MSKKSKLIKNFLVYFIANFGSKILVFFLYPIYTFYLTTEELGAYDIVISCINLFLPIISLCIYEGVLRWLLSEEASKEDILTISYSFLVLDMIFLSAVGLLSHIMGYRISQYILLLFTNVVYTVVQYISRGLKNSIAYASSGIIYTTVLVSLNLFFLRFIRIGINGLIYSQIIASFIAIVYLIIKQRRVMCVSVINKINMSLYKDVCKYSILLVPNNINWWILNASDRFIIKFFLGDSINGIYAISYKFPSIINMFTSVFYLAWQEQSIQEYNSKDRNSYFSGVFKGYYMLLFFCSFVLSIATKYLLPLITETSYHSAWKYTSFLYVAGVFYALASFVGAKFLSEKNTKEIMKTSFLAAIINFLLNVLLINMIGLYAAAISTFIAFGVLCALRIYQGRDIIKIDNSFYICLGTNIIVIPCILVSNLWVDLIVLLLGILFYFFINRVMISHICKKVKFKI